jgi:hypothetical protein
MSVTFTSLGNIENLTMPVLAFGSDFIKDLKSHGFWLILKNTEFNCYSCFIAKVAVLLFFDARGVVRLRHIIVL